ncbi:hypothetical protein EZV73_23655 [Acidaminobacter sp. JC074]|uniref:aminotransferase class IV n=1 Tax=Acidaminobacter sp. JC074 TaxID=2530199 RepID=UPI001F0E010A|nr:aminotransferase class IV [Acidaminobacter sp. JC074]MCH4890598.1 hypothetical protein [Acidaminobacter sp. JC074]
MYQNIGKYYIRNGKTVPSYEFELVHSDLKIIYEVIRVIDGTALFLKDHLVRLSASLEKSQMVADVDDIEKSIHRLIDMYPEYNKNIKIDVTENNYRLYFMESFYPDEDKYRQGVYVKTANIVRENPNIKRLNMDYKRHIEAIKGDAFEVLLVNKDGFVTEGSRANLVFVKDQTLFSAPLEEILVGITFKNVLSMAENKSFSIDYTSVKLEDIKKMDACFLTGTSLGILPIHQIDDHIFGSETNHVVLELRQAYNQEIKGDQ